MSKITDQTQGCAVIRVYSHMCGATVFLMFVPTRCGQEQELKKL